MKLVIAKVDQVYYDGEAYSVTVPGTEGVMTVLTDHEPLITTLKAGTIVVHESQGSEPKTFPIESGMLEVRQEGATVLI